MREKWTIENDLYGYRVPYVKTIYLDNGVTDAEETVLMSFKDTTSATEITHIVVPSFGGVHAFKRIYRFEFERRFNYCEYEQFNNNGIFYVPGGYVDFAVYAVCDNEWVQVDYLKTRNQAKRLVHKLNRALQSGKRIFKLNHTQFEAF